MGPFQNMSSPRRRRLPGSTVDPSLSESIWMERVVYIEVVHDALINCRDPVVPSHKVLGPSKPT